MTPAIAFLLLASLSAESEGATPVGPVPPPPGAEPAPAIVQPIDCRQLARMEAYQQFRDFYQAELFEEALGCAKRVVELSEVDPDRDYELPIAYNNLGAAQFQVRDYAGAADSYGKSLELLESSQGISSRRLVVPLAGLGAVFAARNEHIAAAELFDRALAVSRRAEGLFNLQQLPLIKQAADSRYAIADYVGAEREHMYALKVAEQNYGFGDPRTLPQVLDFAAFYERLGEYSAARGMYMRARDVSMNADPGYSPTAIRSLIGISRTHRLQYTVNPDSLEDPHSLREEVSATDPIWIKTERQSVERGGLKSAQMALELLRSTSNPPQELMTDALLEIGDWYQSTSRPELSMPYYTEAATLFEARTAADPLSANPLKAPRMVYYRPPPSANRRRDALPGQYLLRKAVFSFGVTDAGLPQEITVVSTDMREEQLAQARRAMSKSIYSPRFTEGKAVSTAGVLFTSEWYDENMKAAQQEQEQQQQQSQPSAETKPDEAAPVEKSSTGPGRGGGN